MFKGVLSKKRKISKNKINLLKSFSKLEVIDKISRKVYNIIPIKVTEPLMPYGNSIKFNNDDYLINIYNKIKDKEVGITLDNENDSENLSLSQQKLAAFFHDKKKNKTSIIGVECDISYYLNTKEISLVSKLDKDRLLLPNTNSDATIELDHLFEGKITTAEIVSDLPSKEKLIDYEFANNIVGDINKSIMTFLEITSKHITLDSLLLRELNSTNIFLQSLLRTNIDFLTNCKNEHFGQGKSNDEMIGLHKLNTLVYKNYQEVLKLVKGFRKVYPFLEIENFLLLEDPIVRTKMLIETVYELGDFAIKDLHMYEEYKKDTTQKQEKYFYKFIKKQVDKIAGSENVDDYKNKLDSWQKNGDISPETRRSVELEVEQAFSTNNSNEMIEYDDRKKLNIVDDIFSFPWDKRDDIVYDIHHAQEVLESNLYGMKKVKERIYEYVAKLKRTQKNSKKGFVILVTGPPGTGKTTIATLIGKALKRKTGVINLSGENDVVTLKGSRRTYVDSQPSNNKNSN
jgi:ATP-dependent Lon protease